MHRRRFLNVGLASAAAAAGIRCGGPVSADTPSGSPSQQRAADDNRPDFEAQTPPPEAGESLIAWVKRVRGQWDQTLYRQMLGAANEFKEGDEIIGVAAINPTTRKYSRQLLSHTTIEQIDSHPQQSDDLFEIITAAIDPSVQQKIAAWTIGDLKTFLLQEPESAIHEIRHGLSSDVIAAVVRLMNNDELTVVGSKVFNPLPGSQIGAKGYMGARIQPNSPTDHPDDIRWQVLSGFAFAVGDVLIGTNPVSSETASVISVQQVLQDLLVTFGIDDILPHCVLSHIDIQAEAERTAPGLTELWFQSIAGNDSANATFDITTEKMLAHARSRHGRFGLYFETGQGADFTNGHGHGLDMVILESRKYGFARALAQAVPRKNAAGQSWVHLNDVAGFIGPEVFRTRDQLVRCCLEDIVMGKLHGLMIGLDICSTLHMDVSLDDLEWCIDQIMPANPGYLMALPTRIDPMLGYLTTSFQDHVHVRERFGYRVNDPMWAFFKSIGIIDAAGQPTKHFGDPGWVYLQYCRRRNDARDADTILAEAKTKMAEVRSRGVFLASGYGASPAKLTPTLAAEVQHIYEDAKRCIWEELPTDFKGDTEHVLPLSTRAKDREDYILHPLSGEYLSDQSRVQLTLRRNSLVREDDDCVIVVSDGLNALAVTDEGQLDALLVAIRKTLEAEGFRIAPGYLLVRSGRVRAGYRIGETLLGGRSGQKTLLHIIGERPGSGHHTLSIYMTTADGATWAIPDRVDHNITKVVSGIAFTALRPDQAAKAATRILQSMVAAKT
jgi:ethanolamine ammonia-lyase large subunit